MKFGFVKTAAITPEIKVADCHYNAGKIMAFIDKFKEQEIELALLPELCLTSVSCGDLFTQPHFISECERAIAKIKAATAGCNTIIVFGAPIEYRNSIYNCAVVIHNGDIVGIVPKETLDNSEYRWFTSGSMLPGNSYATIAGEKVPFTRKTVFNAGTYTFGIEVGSEAEAPLSPGAELAIASAQIILNPAAGHAVAGMHKLKKERIAQQSARYKCSYVYAGAGWGESTSSVVYPGYCAIAEDGEIVSEYTTLSTEGSTTITETDTEKARKLRKGNTGFSHTADTTEVYIAQKENNSTYITRSFNRLPFIPQGYTIDEYCREAFNIQSAALAKRICHIGAQSCVIGISGGLDSTLALLATAKACDMIGKPHSDIIAVTMPGFGTSDRTYRNAMTLMESLGTSIKEISIKAACIQHFKDIEHDIEKHDITYENAQARERTQILMDIANQKNGIVIGTGDLSELALGWATYNGDQMSMYGVNASIPKTLMQHIVRWVAKNSDDTKTGTTLLDIVDTPISPELTPADEKGNIKQKTEDLVGPYELHDFFIYNFMRFGFSPEKIHMMATKAFEGEYDSQTIKKWLTTFMRRFFAQQFKRAAMPDGPQTTCCSLSPQGGWYMTSDTSGAAWSINCEKIQD